MSIASTTASPHAVRSAGGLSRRLIRQWWPQVAALTVACGVVTATIVGALGVGDGVQRGLESLAVERLGGIDAAVLGDDLFTDRLTAETTAMLHESAPAARAVAAIVTEVTVEAPSSGRPVRATLLACDDVEGLGFASHTPEQSPAAGLLVNTPLATAVGAAVGDSVVLRIPERSAVPADSPLGRRDAVAAGRRLRIDHVLPDAGLGRFSLRPVQETAPLVVASLATARGMLRRGNVANTIFLVGAGRSFGAGDGRRPRPALADYGLTLRAEPPDGPSMRLTSRRLILPPEIDRAAAQVLEPLGGRRSLALLAVSLAPRGTAGETRHVSVPYSTVIGIESSSLPVGDLVDASGRMLPPPRPGEIVVNQWLADDLAAQGRPIAVGDPLDVRCFLPETLHSRVEETTATFRISGIAAMRGAAIARELVPEVEGVTDEESIADWDPPFPFDQSQVRTTPPHDEDDRYWKTYRATPKAFVSLADAERLAGGRFGRSTAWHLPATNRLDAEELCTRLERTLRPEALGIRLVPLRAEALAASRGSTPFGGLFLALSSFVVGAGLVLVWLLFRLLVEARRHDIGLLAAVGWSPARIARLLLCVGASAAVMGAGLGLVIGPAWAAALRRALGRAWTADVAAGAAAVFASPAIDARPLLLGTAAALATSLVALAAAARRAGGQPPLALLRGRDDPSRPRLGRRATLIGGLASLFASVVVASLAARATPATAVAAFFVSGITALVGMLAGVRLWLSGGSRRQPIRTVGGLARRGLAYRPGRPLAVATIVGVAQFLIVAVSAFALRLPADPSDRRSPTGGWTSLVTFGEPTTLDPRDPAARERLGLSQEESRALAATDLAVVRSSGGDDASCTNLYAATRPTVLGVGPGFIARGGFRFVAHASSEDPAVAANPWRLLDGRPASGAVPVVLDQATAQWALRVGGVGSGFTVTGDDGGPIPCEVVGLIDGGILQGFVITSDAWFTRMFPSRSGYGLAVIDDRLVEPDMRPKLLPMLARVWADAGCSFTPALERLRRLQAVQNTFLGGFQALAALGLLLGTAGVAAVQAQGLLERIDTLAVLKAIGFRSATLRRLIVGETLWTVGLGLAAGSLAGCLAVAPLLAGGTGRVPLAWMAFAGGLTLASAAVTCLVAANWQAIPERPRAT